MTVPIYVVSLTISLSMGWNADRTNQKPWHIIAATVLGAVSFVITATVNVAAVKYAFICFGGAGIWTAVPLFLSWMVGNFEGREKRAVSIAMINGFGESRVVCGSVLGTAANDLLVFPGNLASVYGSFIWPKSDAPKYTAGFATTTALIAAGGVVVFLLKWKLAKDARRANTFST